jgi:hypothetical protein
MNQRLQKYETARKTVKPQVAAVPLPAAPTVKIDVPTEYPSTDTKPPVGPLLY